MLRMTPSTSAAHAIDYFRRALRRGEYYTTEHIHDQEVVGLWGGEAAKRLGLEDSVEIEAYENLCNNLHPETGERLSARHKDNRRVGYDFNFHVPKSVSAMLEIGGDRRILDAFREAVQETMREIESEMLTRVRKGGENTNRHTGNLVWAEFVHFTARPVDGYPDPHLHAHVFTQNVTWDPAESRWKAGEFGDIKRDMPYFQAAYHARLAGHLIDLGYRIERRGDGWEIAGVPETVVQAFSRRTAEIERVAAERGIRDKARKSELAAETRKHKIDQFSMEDLRGKWLRVLPAAERRAMRGVRSVAERAERAATDVAKDIAASLDHAVKHVFERVSVISERRLLAAMLEHGVGKITPGAARELFESQVKDRAILRTKHEGEMRVSTPKVWNEEREMLQSVKEGRGMHAPLAPDHQIRDAELSDEQRKAVEHVLNSTDSVIILRGRAGVGKTRMMREVVDAINETRRSVQASAPTAMASHEVLKEDGFTNAKTVAALLTDPETKFKLWDQVLWVDEAGLVSVPDMNRLVALAKEAGARLLLTGDTAQHRSVIRGDALRQMEAKSGIRPFELREVRRQKVSEYRLAVERLAAGDLEAGFARLNKMGAVHEIADDKRAAELANAYTESIEAGKTTLVVSPTHAEGREVTQAIRKQLRDAKLIGDDNEVSRLVNRHLSDAERQDAVRYKVGDVIEFHQNVPGGIRRSDRGVIIHADGQQPRLRLDRTGQDIPLPLKHAKRFAVYERSATGVATGDRVRITSNGRTKDGKHRLHNGTIYEVKGFTREGDMRLANGWVVGRDFGHITHGYCVTSDASQGRTIDHVILAQSSESAAASHFQQFYTSVSRGRFMVSIFTDDKERLLRSVARDTSRLSAVELFGLVPSNAVFRNMKALGMWMSQQRHRVLKARANQQIMEQQRERHRQQQLQQNRDRGREGPSRER